MASREKIRKWKEDYTEYGFTKTIIDGVDRLQCVLCNAIFSNSNLKPSKLGEHGGNTREVNDLNSLKAKRACYDIKGTLLKLGFTPVDKPLLLASFKVAYEVAKMKKPHTVLETLIKQCVLHIVKTILGAEAARKVQQIPLSNNVIRSRIDDIGADILDQVVSNIKAFPVKISIQLDESTDVNNCSQLIVFIRYVKGNAIEEEFLFCKSLETTTTARDVFNTVKSFFNTNEIPLQIIGSICTDSAPVMLGNRSGFVTLVRNEVPEVTVTHCILHLQALVSKTLPVTLKNVVDSCVKIINFIRGRALNHRLFNAFCSELNDDASILLFHTEVRWIFRGRVLTRFFQLRKEIKQFLQEQKCDFLHSFEFPYFTPLLAYLADIFQHLNDLNCSIQGKEMNIVTTCDKLRAFRNKLLLWSLRIQNKNVANFPLLNEVIVECSSLNFKDSIKEEISQHLESLKESFDVYFCLGDLEESETWIVNPFAFKLEKMRDEDEDKEHLIEMQACQAMKLLYESSSLETFCCNVQTGYSTLAKRALKVLVPFATTWLCELGFSSLLYIKNKYRNALNPENDLRIY
ncbi:protein ZBED8-like [Erpetoichthys calabaricus]|uniref:protein ZBED8-like n=1 Tax=Erpetoichthys calabaricus TaxID=27687 RepID=UPI002233EFBA|nr:protein ZBED8-like [Erpetoichthys calabaricus]